MPRRLISGGHDQYTNFLLIGKSIILFRPTISNDWTNILRYARTDGSTTATCNVADGNYCGGSWRGIINELDYIQNMGFTAVRP